VSDLLTELRREVVGAHAKHQRRSVRSARLRAWRPLFAGAAALAVVLVTIVVALRSVPPPEPSSEPRVVEVVRIGGIPVDGVLAAGALWVADSERSEVVRIDPGTRRVVARIRLTGNVADIAAGEDGLWVRAGGGDEDGDLQAWSRLSRIDPRSNRVVATFEVPPGWPLAVGGGAVWADRRLVPPEGIARIDATSGAVTGQIALRDTEGLAVASGVVWAITLNGTVARIDEASGRIARRWPLLAPSASTAETSKAIAPDAGGAWVLSAELDAIFRLEGERVTRKLAIDTSAEPILARARDGLWIAATDEVRGRHRVARIDPASGKETAVVDLGAHRTRALVPVAGGLWVISGDGTAVLIET
jgi:hypothetical protein